MVFTTLKITQWNEARAFTLLSHLHGRLMHNAVDTEPLQMKLDLLLLQRTLMLIEPSLALHLKNICFEPELYAVGWLVSGYSQVLRHHHTTAIWDLAIVKPIFKIVLAACFMADLKEKLRLLGVEEAMSSMAHLVGVVDQPNAVYLAGLLVEHLPRGFWEVPYALDKEDLTRQQQNSYYQSRPWDLLQPLETIQNQLHFSITVHDLLNTSTKVYLLDIREPAQFQEKSLKNSLNMPYTDTANRKTYLAFLQAMSNQLVSLDRLKSTLLKGSGGKRVFSVGQLPVALFIVIDSHDSIGGVQFVQQLFKEGIPYSCILQGGIQAVEADAPELIKPGRKQTPIQYYKKKISISKQG